MRELDVGWTETWVWPLVYMKTLNLRSDDVSRPSVKMDLKQHSSYSACQLPYREKIQRYNLVAFTGTFSSAVGDEAWPTRQHTNKLIIPKFLRKRNASGHKTKVNKKQYINNLRARDTLRRTIVDGRALACNAKCIGSNFAWDRPYCLWILSIDVKKTLTPRIKNVKNVFFMKQIKNVKKRWIKSLVDE